MRPSQRVSSSESPVLRLPDSSWLRHPSPRQERVTPTWARSPRPLFVGCPFAVSLRTSQDASSPQSPAMRFSALDVRNGNVSSPTNGSSSRPLSSTSVDEASLLSPSTCQVPWRRHGAANWEARFADSLREEDHEATRPFDRSSLRQASFMAAVAGHSAILPPAEKSKWNKKLLLTIQLPQSKLRVKEKRRRCLLLVADVVLFIQRRRHRRQPPCMVCLSLGSAPSLGRRASTPPPSWRSLAGHGGRRCSRCGPGRERPRGLCQLSSLSSHSRHLACRILDCRR